MNHKKIELEPSTASSGIKTHIENELDRYDENETVFANLETQKNLAREAQANAEIASEQPQKTIDELKSDIIGYREQIRLGETKGANGRYNEKLVLENEAKLKEAEKMINEKIEEEKKQNQINEIRKEIAGYREQIKVGETKGAGGQYNEKLVLENEAKLREAEKKINELEGISQKNIETTAPAPVATKKKRSWLKGLFSSKK